MKTMYFNNGTMGPSPQIVIDSLVDKINMVNSTGHYGDSELSRKKIAELIKADVSEISLTHNTTEGINIICWGLKLKKGDGILLSNHEHVGGALPWLNRAKVDQLKVQVYSIGNSGYETFSNIKKLVNGKTKVIAIPHITCTTGQIQPIREIAIWAKNQGIKVVVDGAHGTGLLDLDMKKLEVDYYISCCHKWLCAPKGTGFFYIRKEALESIQPLFVGAGSDKGWSTNTADGPNIIGYADTAHRFDYGTQNTSLWVGVNAAIDYFHHMGMHTIQKRAEYLNDYFYEGLQELKNYSILTPPNKSERIGMVCFKHKRIPYKECNVLISKEKIRVRVVPEHGIDGIRASFHVYNLESQIDTLLKTLASIS